ncbi:hypothetical protein SmJEL517_g02076 [Synchytrium microbalum]|uniref:Major facilitator superfamily (MFS) profile domain-containing protein n=1 Tax=Synchytrium microbalum TaxID=1806994 RepID=A0A507C1Q4_9FUNG|nr:uncharacterized protein SmJEL517_g02076 [Synchytrium microbalum]TPX35460.1 hypothetical protein SmJEL517_g02076 [Synchytrium microbalum]
MEKIHTENDLEPLDVEKLSASSVQADQDGLKPPPLSTGRLVTIILGLAICVFMFALDSTIVNTAAIAMTSDLGGLNQIPWVSTSYLLTSTIILPLVGKFSDIFGRRSSMLFSIIMFLVGSVLCGASNTMNMLIISRGVQGLGGGGLLSLVFIIVGDIVALRDRGRYQGIVSGCLALALLAGPVLGGVIADSSASWRWIFYINLPPGIVAAGIVALLVRIPVKQENLATKLRRIDILGSITLAIFCVLILLAILWGGESTYPWNSPIIISLFVVGFVFIGIFVFVESRVAEPILPIRLFNERNFNASLVATFCFGFVFFGAVYELPVFFQLVNKSSASISGVQGLPISLGFIITATLGGAIAAINGRYVWAVVVGTGLMCVGSGLLSLLTYNNSIWFESIAQLIFGLGAGLVLTGQVALKPFEHASGTSAINFMRTIGGVFGVAVFGSLLNQVWFSQYESLRQAAGLPALSVLSSQSDFNIYLIKQLPPVYVQVVTDALSQAIRPVFFLAAAVCAVGFFATCLIKHIDLNSEITNNIESGF